MITLESIKAQAQRASLKNVNIQYKEYTAKKVLFVYLYEGFGNSPKKMTLFYNFSKKGIPMALYRGEEQVNSPFHLPIPKGYKEALDLFKTVKAASK